LLQYVDLWMRNTGKSKYKRPKEEKNRRLKIIPLALIDIEDQGEQNGKCLVR
jgi:hypothetical protein